MYFDIVVLAVIILLVIFSFRKFSSFVYIVAILDILLRILNFIRINVPVPELQTLLEAYFPASIPAVIDKYTSGVVFDLIMWAFVIIYIIFLSYVFKTFIKKKH